MRRYFPLRESYDATLATLGADTRRNFRRFRRRAETHLQCAFVPEASASLADFLALNRSCAYPVPEPVARWRYASVHAEAGCFMAGLRGSAGEWLSLLGGRRYGATTALDWQMNRVDFASSSLSTVLRGYLIEHEVARRADRMLFEGGTPHAMHSAFLPETAVNLVAAPAWLHPETFFPVLSRMLPHTNVLAETLGSRSLRWHGSQRSHAGHPIRPIHEQDPVQPLS